MLRALALSLVLFLSFSAVAQPQIPTGPEFPAIPDVPPLPPPLAQQTHVSTITTAAASLLMWHETIGHTISQVHLGRVGSDGRAVNATVRPSAPSSNIEKHPRAASDGRNILVIWVEEAPQFNRQILGLFTGLSGEPGHSAPFLIADGIVGDVFGVPDQQNPAAITWTGEHYLVAWSDRAPWMNPREDPPLERIRFTRVTSDGIVLDPEGRFVPESGRKMHQTRPALAATGDGHAFLAWQDGEEYLGCMITCPAPPPPPRIAGVVIAPGGLPASSEEIVLSERLNRLRPAVAWNGHHFLIAWKNREDLRIEAARVNLDGHVVEGEDRILIIGDRTYSPDPLALVAVGDRFIVAWSDPLNDAAFASALLSSTVDRDGNVSGPWTVSFGPDRRRPDLLRTNAGGLLFYYDRSIAEPLGLLRIFGTGTTGYSVRRRPAR